MSEETQETEVNEPEKFHIADWIAEATIATLIAMGGGLSEWIRRTRKARRDAMEARVKQLEDLMAETAKTQSQHAELIAVAQENLKNLEKWMDDIRETAGEQTALLNAILVKCSK